MPDNFTEDIQDYTPEPTIDPAQELNNEQLKQIIYKLRDRIRDIESRLTAGGL